jgi:hypothetical protein
LWLGLIGTTEGPRRRSSRVVTFSIEPALEIVQLRLAEFRGNSAKILNDGSVETNVQALGQ